MNILVVGNGGREHALAWKIAQSSRADKVFVAPGNAGTEVDAENVDISTTDFPRLIEFAKQNDVELTVIGPEAPLAAGIVDAFRGQICANLAFLTVSAAGAGIVSIACRREIVAVCEAY